LCLFIPDFFQLCCRLAGRGRFVIPFPAFS